LPQGQKALMTVWKQDRCGCKGLRVSENAEQLLQLLLRGRLHEADVQVLLGPADETRRIQKSHYLVYRLDGKCGKQAKDEEGFLCFLRYEIGSKSHKVVGGDLICF
jgi:hypothetical protein